MNTQGLSLSLTPTRSGHTSGIHPLLPPVPLSPCAVEGRRQEVMKPLFLFSSRAAEEVERGGRVRCRLGAMARLPAWGLWVHRVRLPLALLGLRGHRLLPSQGGGPLGQLDADGVLGVPHPFTGQHRRQEGHLGEQQWTTELVSLNCV